LLYLFIFFWWYILILIIIIIIIIIDIIDKTASFVARNTVQFENLIKEKEKYNPKFSFLNPNDPYYSYYQYKIKESKDGKSNFLFFQYFI